MKLTRGVGAALGLIAGGICGGCTTLGPMPASTGLSAVPAGRPDGEIGFGPTPGYFLSAGTQASPEGAGLTQGSLVIEPDRLIHLPGLIVGARRVGSADSGAYFEPLAGYRLHLDHAQRVSAMAVGYFTKASGTKDGASYKATRGGAEVGFDARITPQNRWFELHASASAALTGLSASGHYCLDSAGQFGVTCADPPVPASMTAVSVSGLYPSATAGVALDLFRHHESFFHGGRLGLLFATGTLPTATGGQQKSAHWYTAAGAALTVAFGAAR